MPLVRDVNQFLTLFIDTFRSFGRGMVWLILFAYFVFMSLVLYSYFNFLTPLTYPIAHLTASIFGGDIAERFFHYPGHFLYLPVVFGSAKTLFSVLLDGLVLGSAALFFRGGYLGERGNSARHGSSLVASWGHLILASLIFNLLIYVVMALLEKVSEPFLVGYNRRMWAFTLVVLPGAYSLILAMFFFVIPRIALYGENVLRALINSFRTFARRPFTCFFLSAVILFVPVMLATAANRSDLIIEKFHPEVVFWLLWLGLVADLISYFLWMGTAVRFLVDDEH